MGMILVTGGTGFLGSELVHQLRKKGEKVRILARSHVEGEENFVMGDVSDPESLDMAMKGVEAVFHLAALVDHFAPEKDLERVNVIGSRNAIEAAVRNKVRIFIHCSSVSAEKGGGSSAYGRSKIRAEKEILKYRRKIRIIIIRPGPVYDSERKMLRNIMLLPRYLHVFGVLWPDATIHLASRKNVISGFLLSLRKARAGRKLSGNAYAICDRFPIKRSKLSMIICKNAKAVPVPVPYPVFYPFLYAAAVLMEAPSFLGIRPLLTRQYLKVLSRERVYDVAPAMRELGYSPDTTEKGFGEAVRRILS